jgi:hypothetical protein
MRDMLETNAKFAAKLKELEDRLDMHDGNTIAKHSGLNNCVFRGEEFWLMARSEEGKYPQRSLTNKRQSQKTKEPPPGGFPVEAPPSGRVAPYSQTARVCSLVAPCHRGLLQTTK